MQESLLVGWNTLMLYDKYIKKHKDTEAEYIFGWREDLKRVLLKECEWKIVRKVCFALLFANMELFKALRVDTVCLPSSELWLGRRTYVPVYEPASHHTI